MWKTPTPPENIGPKSLGLCSFFVPDQHKGHTPNEKRNAAEIVQNNSGFMSMFVLGGWFGVASPPLRFRHATFGAAKEEVPRTQGTKNESAKSGWGQQKGDCQKIVINCRKMSQDVLWHSMTIYDIL